MHYGKRNKKKMTKAQFAFVILNFKKNIDN